MNINVPKLKDATEAGKKNSKDCTLILTEGDSAKSLAIAGLSSMENGNKFYGVFPLRGKFLNVREAGHLQVTKNAEIINILKIMGLKYNVKYDDQADVSRLRYGKIMIMADQDVDGSHIKGLIINFFHNTWPHLLRRNILEEFITPIVKVGVEKTIIININ